MAPKFGTSGLRGLVTELTPDLVGAHIRAFIAACDTGGAIYLGWDLRPSSPDIAASVSDAARSMGCDVVNCGAVPTPALALAARQAGAAAAMITGSHIPADRNGIKFYTPRGEITKTDEAAITAALSTPPGAHQGALRHDADVGAKFVNRYTSAFGGALKGLRVGLYAHSAVGRDLLAQIMAGCGADVIELGWSATFIPVDTEAVDPNTRQMIADWVAEHRLDALVSTDGDSDRPLLADAAGQIVPGDILGQITAESLGAETIVTPISSNSGVMQKGAQVIRTKIGSPYVIAGMESAGGAVVGYEANGGFLLGFDAPGMVALPTRDCMLPIIVTLAQGPVATRVAQEPSIVTLADRLQNIAQETSAPFVAQLAQDADARARFLAELNTTPADVDLTDGVRMATADGRIVHIRPSGNAPELRLYVEAQNHPDAQTLLDAGLDALRSRLG